MGHHNSSYIYVDGKAKIITQYRKGNGTSALELEVTDDQGEYVQTIKIAADEIELFIDTDGGTKE